jgi:hypothetical protein
MAITFFGQAASVADNAAVATTIATITPPASMIRGDLVIVAVQVGFGNLGVDEILYSNTGGQAWVMIGSAPGSGVAAPSAHFYACRFTGSWSANPAWDGQFSSGFPIFAEMIVFRDSRISSGDWQFDLDTVITATGDQWPTFAATFTAPSTPFTVTNSGISSVISGSVVYAVWMSTDDNTWDSLTATWTKPGSAQYRTLTGANQQSFTSAYKIDGTGSVAQNQATLGGDAGATWIVAFKVVEAPGLYAPTVDAFVDFEDSVEAAVLSTTILTAVTKPLASPGGTWALNNGPQETMGIRGTSEKHGAGVNAGGYTYADGTGKLGCRYDHNFGTDTANFEFTFTSAKNAISNGFFYRTALAYDSFSNFSGMTLFGLISDDYAVTNINAEGALDHRLRLETLTRVIWCVRILRNTWYWITTKYDNTNSKAYMACFEPDNGWQQLGFTVCCSLATGVQCVSQALVCTGGSFAAEAAFTDMDDLIWDYTNAAFPLLPAIGAKPNPSWDRLPKLDLNPTRLVGRT